MTNCAVLETFPDGFPQQDLLRAGKRLEAALRRRSGNIVVIGEGQDEANLFVSSIVNRAVGCEVIQTSAKRSRLPERIRHTRDANIVAVIYDADVASSHRLEELRIWAQGSTAGLRRVRLLLVGSSKLQRTLTYPGARTLNSCVHARIWLFRRYLHERPVFSQPRRAPRRWPFLTSAFAACAAVVCLGFANASQATPRRNLFHAYKVSQRTTSRAVETSDTLIAAVASLATAPTKSLDDRGITAVTRGAEPSARNRPVVTPSIASRFFASIEHALGGVGRDTVSAASNSSTGPARRYSYDSVSSFPASLTRTFLGGDEIDTGGAVLETLLMLGNRVSSRADVSMSLHVGAFTDVNGAFALETVLLPIFPGAAVARFDGAAGPQYRVRVFGQSAEAIASR